MACYLEKPACRIKKMLSIDQWHERYRQQAEWTYAARQRAYQLSGIGSAADILDVGSGTGALEEELNCLTEARVTCLDISRDNLFYHHGKSHGTLVNADGQHLPFRNNCFDVSLFQYVLLWLHDPLAALREMKRVTRPNGYVVALAEPDYAHRIDNPKEMEPYSRMQREALIKQGANPDIGSSLGDLFFTAGLQIIEVGLTGGAWHSGEPTEHTNLEWLVTQADLGSLVSTTELAHMRGVSDLSFLQGRRVAYLPVFYAVGRVTV
jgi:SAM-dependent methyltransferase